MFTLVGQNNTIKSENVINCFQKWQDNLKSRNFSSKMMAMLSCLYDSRNEKYPIYHSGILAFVITICLPLNIGVSRLPTVDIIVLLLVGFVSLFMLARNERVGFGLLKYLRIPDKKRSVQFDKRFAETKMAEFTDHKFTEPEVYNQDPFVMLQNMVQHIIITHDKHIDYVTRERLENMHNRLQKITREICKI